MRRDDLLDLNDALQHPGRIIAVDLSTELPEEEDLDLIEPLTGSLEAVSTGNMLLVEGKFRAKCVVECARCSGPLETVIEFEMDEQFPVEGVPACYGADCFAHVAPDEPFPLFEENHLIVESLVRQGLLLNMPVQPLCEYGWDGDCPQARERAAQAPREATRSEFAALKGLLNPPEESAS